ncbi:MAG: threonine--tRNA ligase, partial [Patescibacteria group bacterium]|nr:threonine--tRNA ligase [Patescibacteria group bacterium]
QNLQFQKKTITKIQAKKVFKNQPYKLELIKDLSKQATKINTYQVGDFTDLCKGPHVKSTKEIPIDAFKLTRVAGAYWKGEEKNKMLTRIYGTAFFSKKELKDHLEQLREARKRDHRVLGKKLDLFLSDEEIGAGLILWTPKGAMLRKRIEDYLYKELTKTEYDWVVSPHIADLKLWKTSGHWGFYKENMYSPIKVDNEQYMIKPMNCPFHIKIYSSKIRSYKDLPIRLAELGTVYRYEKSGVLHGLTRVRGLTMDDAHIFCTPEQLSEELLKTMKLGIKILKDFGFKDFQIFLSTQPKKYVGNDKIWKKATSALKNSLSSMKLDYEIDKGGGAFYGPKIDIKIKDSIGRPWQCTTIQVDFNLPERFKMSYIGKDGKKKEPIMIHRALVGSLERFIGILIEHHEGAFPLWLSPVQVWVIPIGKGHRKYAKQITDKLKNEGLRAELQEQDETISKKIRNAGIQRIPYSLIIGDKEIKAKKVGLRTREKGDVGLTTLSTFIKKIKQEINKKK